MQLHKGIAVPMDTIHFHTTIMETLMSDLLLEAIKEIRNMKVPQPMIKSSESDDTDVRLHCHLVASNSDDSEIAVTDGQDELWWIKCIDITSVESAEQLFDDLEGTPLELKVSSGAIIRCETYRRIGAHIFNPVAIETESSPPPWCQSPVRCRGGWCCCMSGRKTRCLMSSCVMTTEHC
jgi:hypothetical protein